ncbi:MAG: hypothetical protein KIT25_00060 [Enhydrobacter sp.]|nr:MAG: hypothetical protein KIT25_00060 [Enhydrobacter sp.]
MMRALRRRVRRLRLELMVDRPAQERNLIILAGLGLTGSEEVRASLRDMVAEEARRRDALRSPPPAPSPAAPSRAMPEEAPTDEERPAYWDLKVTGPAPPIMSPEQIAKFWDGVEAEYRRHDAEIMNMTAQAAETRAAGAAPEAKPPRPWPPRGPAQGLDFDEMYRWRPRGEPELYPDPPEKPDPDDPF